MMLLAVHHISPKNAWVGFILRYCIFLSKKTTICCFLMIHSLQVYSLAGQFVHRIIFSMSIPSLENSKRYHEISIFYFHQP